MSAAQQAHPQGGGALRLIRAAKGAATVMAVEFVHLRVHSEFSIIDGLLPPEQLPQAAAELGMPAIALTDHCNFFALIKFYRAALQAGIKPILGCDLRLAAGSPEERSGFSLLVQDRDGYRNLFALVSRAWREGLEHGVPLVHREWLHPESCRGLIALSGGMEGEIGRALLAQRKAQARRLLQEWTQLFPDAFYLELQRIGRPGEEEYLEAALDLGAEHGIPVTATNEVCFLKPGEYAVHEARTCISSREIIDDAKRVRRYTRQQCLRSAGEMAELFADIPSALTNSVEIARRCSAALSLSSNAMPRYPEIPADTSEIELLRQRARAGLRERLDGGEPPQEYRERLEYELDVIDNTGFAGYFLIVMDFVGWSREQGIPVGPGRGSGAGSVTAWALKITDLDPLQYGLLFERFLNPERVSMPDFDIDFCQERRDEVIDYVRQRYGEEKVAHIITFNRMEARAAVRDVARVLNKPYALGDRIARLIPASLDMSLEKAVRESSELALMLRREPEVREVWDLALQLEGRVRNAGRHAGGVVIAPSQLEDFAPLYCDAPGAPPALQLDKADVERVGLVKFDLLGLRTLTVIERALRSIRTDEAAPRDAADIPLDDADTYEMLGQGRTVAVFQLESAGMRDLLQRYRPNVFDDIIALVALYRPGPLRKKMHIDFVERKHKRQKTRYLLPQLEPVLSNTYGVFLYQEQVMESARILAGYSRGQADLLRRAMGAKDSAEMARHRKTFIAGAVQNQLPRNKAEKVFDLMETFSEYGFNRSHAAVYALLAYQTAWLKRHYPEQFMAAEMSTVAENTDRLSLLVAECRTLGIEVLAPDLNRGQENFAAAGKGRINYGLGAIKGFGRGAARSLVAERDQNGEFRDLFDFCQRLDLRKLGNMPALQALVKSGAADCFHRERFELMEILPRAVEFAEQSEREGASGMDDFFGGAAPALEEEDAAPAGPGTAPAQKWSQSRLLREEYAALGLYLSAHPVDAYREEMRRMQCTRIADCAGRHVRVMGLVTDWKKIGDGALIVNLEDDSGALEMRLSPADRDKYAEQLKKLAVFMVTGKLEDNERSFNGKQLVPDKIASAETLRYRSVSQLELRLDASSCTEQILVELQELLQQHRGGNCRPCVLYRNGGTEGVFRFPSEWNIQPSEECLLQLQNRFGADRVRYL